MMNDLIHQLPLLEGNHSKIILVTEVYLMEASHCQNVEQMYNCYFEIDSLIIFLGGRQYSLLL